MGRNLNQHFFGECFGTAGATIIFLMLYFISLLFLTNFQLGEWIRTLWGRRAVAEGEPATEEEVLERRARDLQKQVKKLEDEVERSGLGAGHASPSPRPPSVTSACSQPNKAGRGKKPAQPEPVKEPAPAEEVEVIPAREVAAATVGDILGKKSESQPRPNPATPKLTVHLLRRLPPGKRRPSPSPNPRCHHAPGLPAKRRAPRGPSPLPSPPRP